MGDTKATSSKTQLKTVKKCVSCFSKQALSVCLIPSQQKNMSVVACLLKVRQSFNLKMQNRDFSTKCVEPK